LVLHRYVVPPMPKRLKQRRMTRTPWPEVRYELAREVGFGCPVPACASPYLEWHHFDPEWHVRHHHDVEGMIALCHEHHAKAGAGAFTLDQLRELKQKGAANTESVSGRFDWLRNELLVVTGSVTYHETLTVLKIGKHPVVWLTRDSDRLLRLNLDVPGEHGRKRLQMRDNFWFRLGGAEQVICPTGGKSLVVNYPAGDRVAVEFREVKDIHDWNKRYPRSGMDQDTVNFPVTVVDVALRIKRLTIDFKSRAGGTTLPGVRLRGGAFMSNCEVGISLD
jgi:hypothetical protein